MTRLAAAAALLLAAACSPGIRPTAPTPSATPTPTTADPCAAYPTLSADVDGDGRADRAYHAWVGDGPQLGVCFATGAYVTTDGVGMTELFAVLDVDGDGKDELLPGGTTVDTRGNDVYEYEAGRLVRLPIEMLSGGVDQQREWGCPDHRLVQVTVEGTTATITTYVLRDGHVTATTEHRAVASGTPASTLVEPCPKVSQ